MNYTIKNIRSIVAGKFLQFDQDDVIENLLIDSRKIFSASSSLFIALKGPRRDGHQFISELFEKGTRNFIVSKEIDVKKFKEANFILVDDALHALQALAAYHRKQFSIPVIAITGSNGKTIVKEWLYQLLHEKFNIVRSPKSYNSQIGVPLSVWQINSSHNLAIFEAGISQSREMEKLAKIIRPTIGILTNIGEAHSEGFADMKEKLKEKLKLFDRPNVKVIYSSDNKMIADSAVHFPFIKYEWGKTENIWLQILRIEKQDQFSEITVHFQPIAIGSSDFSFRIPFTDDASIENAIHCCAVMLLLNIEPAYITKKMSGLLPVDMRLELKKGINHCTIINDSYSADLSSLTIALNFLAQQSSDSYRTVILSDFFQSGQNDPVLYGEIAKQLFHYEVNRVIGIGEHISKHLRFDSSEQKQKIELHLYRSVDEFINQFLFSHFKEETILVKGARLFEFERIVHLLEEKVHQTVLEINLNAIVHNVNQYQKLLKPSTKLMAMVKAFAYGSGGAEIAGILQFHKIDYLGVAYADEGVELRKAGIQLQIMVMNPEPSTFDAIVENNLEPDIYSLELLKQFDSYLNRSAIQQFPVHIEIETGMNRLGFDVEDVKKLGEFLNRINTIKVQSVFTHLAASEDPLQDDFTMKQKEKFETATGELEKLIRYKFLKHIANSAAISRLPQLQMDMVRLGIGMYGVDAFGKMELQTVATLKSTVAQIKQVKAGESVSYNRKGIVKKDSIIATVRIGYADGYPRRLGNGPKGSGGKMLVKGQLAPVIGTVCMDMTMIDVTNIEGVSEGDEVIVFGKDLPIGTLAASAQTIPYEIMTGISQRVKRVYYQE
jgi:alanine racemase